MAPQNEERAARLRAQANDPSFENVWQELRWRGLVHVSTDEAALEQAFEADRGFAVPTMAFTPTEVLGIVADAEELAAHVPSLGRQYAYLLKEAPPASARKAVAAASTATDRLELRGRAVHLVLATRDDYYPALVSNAWVEKQVGVTSTNRNLTVLRAIAQKWCG